MFIVNLPIYKSSNYGILVIIVVGDFNKNLRFLWHECVQVLSFGRNLRYRYLNKIIEQLILIIFRLSYRGLLWNNMRLKVGIR